MSVIRDLRSLYRLEKRMVVTGNKEDAHRIEDDLAFLGRDYVKREVSNGVIYFVRGFK